MFRIHSRVVLTLGAIAFAGILSACGSSGDTTSTTTSQVSASATPTAAPTPVGTDNGLCTATATMSLPAPPSPNFTQTVTGVLTCTNGIAPTGAIMHAVWHEEAINKTCDATADATGIASCSRQIGTSPPGYKVVIDVTFGLNGAAYATTTSFTPQGSLSVTPTAAPTPVGTDNGLCSATATMSLPAPPSPNYTQTVTGVLTCANGIAPTGAVMHAVWHEKAADKTCDAPADATGTASCSRQIGTLTSGYKVVIDVTFGFIGAAYATTTSFTPQ
jgi:hypothetical protein